LILSQLPTMAQRKKTISKDLMIINNRAFVPREGQHKKCLRCPNYVCSIRPDIDVCILCNEIARIRAKKINDDAFLEENPHVVNIAICAKKGCTRNVDSRFNYITCERCRTLSTRSTIKTMHQYITRINNAVTTEDILNLSPPDIEERKCSKKHCKNIIDATLKYNMCVGCRAKAAQYYREVTKPFEDAVTAMVKQKYSTDPTLCHEFDDTFQYSFDVSTEDE